MHNLFINKYQFAATEIDGSLHGLSIQFIIANRIMIAQFLKVSMWIIFSLVTNYNKLSIENGLPHLQMEQHRPKEDLPTQLNFSLKLTCWCSVLSAWRIPRNNKWMRRWGLESIPHTLDNEENLQVPSQAAWSKFQALWQMTLSRTMEFSIP